MSSVFLSYDRDDTDRARSIALALEKAGHSVWWDLHVRGGAQFGKVIEEALKAADAVVVLWSVHSVESAWVRDEAAAGRDSGRLVPVTLDGTQAPLGFRQFQTIDLSRWSGRGKAKLEPLLEAISSFAPDGQATRNTALEPPSAASSIKPFNRASVAAGALALLLLIAATGWWAWNKSRDLPVVEVAAANASARSQAAASDLFVKLGSLAQIGQGKWQLVDAAAAPARPDFVFRTADTGSPAQVQANLVLLDGNDNALLWSREFSARPGSEADLRQQLSFTAGRVLACALETRDAGGLPRDLLKMFLNTCANLAEASLDEPAMVIRPLRSILAAKPRFIPSWRRLLVVDKSAIEVAEFHGRDPDAAVRELRNDMEKARRVAPDLPELALAELAFLPATDYERSLALISKAAEQAPENVELSGEESLFLQRVGRMSDAVRAARRIAELDPLSPAAATQFIMTLAYAGQLDEARRELARAERVWAGTDALRDAQWGFYLRFGDPKVAKQYASFSAPVLDLYLDVRADPSQANVDKLVATLRQYQKHPDRGMFAFAVQALGEFDRSDDLLRWLAITPADQVASDSYVLFRPALRSFRRESRFMIAAKRIGLTKYWRSTGKWPDFCAEPGLPYDCKAEVAKVD